MSGIQDLKTPVVADPLLDKNEVDKVTTAMVSAYPASRKSGSPGHYQAKRDPRSGRHLHRFGEEKEPQSTATSTESCIESEFALPPSASLQRCPTTMTGFYVVIRTITGRDTCLGLLSQTSRWSIHRPNAAGAHVRPHELVNLTRTH